MLNIFFHVTKVHTKLYDIQDYFSVLMGQLPLKCIISKVAGFILLCFGNQHNTNVLCTYGMEEIVTLRNISKTLVHCRCSCTCTYEKSRMAVKCKITVTVTNLKEIKPESLNLVSLITSDELEAAVPGIE